MALVLVLAALAGGCGHGGLPGGVAGPTLQSVEVPPERSLFRVRFEGAQDSGSMRLALYRARADRFQLRASDTFGRALWSLSVDTGSARIVDYRSNRYCESRDEVRLPAVALAPLPIGGLPEMLSGRLPVAPAAGQNLEGGEFRDSVGRRWTVVLDQEAVESWALWEGGEPYLWWRRQEKGGILSHRSGSQFRWRLSVVEPLREAIEELLAPPDFEQVDCSILSDFDASSSGR